MNQNNWIKYLKFSIIIYYFSSNQTSLKKFKKEKWKKRRKKKSDYRGACKWSISLFISRAFSIFDFLFRPHSERERTLQTKNLQILGLLKLSLISLFSFPFLPIHHTMGANSMLTESTHDLDEQISQLMQCKPLSEQQVSFNFPHLLRSASLLTNFATKMSISLIFLPFRPLSHPIRVFQVNNLWNHGWFLDLESKMRLFFVFLVI